MKMWNKPVRNGRIARRGSLLERLAQLVDQLRGLLFPERSTGWQLASAGNFGVRNPRPSSVRHEPRVTVLVPIDKTPLLEFRSDREPIQVGDRASFAASLRKRLEDWREQRNERSVLEEINRRRLEES